MKKFIAIMALFTCVTLYAVGCTQQDRAKNFGGSMTETIPANQKLVNVTWKEAEMWILTRPMKEGEEAETYTFKQSSRWGILEGEVVLKESKTK